MTEHIEAVTKLAEGLEAGDEIIWVSEGVQYPCSSEAVAKSLRAVLALVEKPA